MIAIHALPPSGLSDCVDLNQIIAGKKGLAFAKTEQAAPSQQAHIAGEVRTDAPRVGEDAQLFCAEPMGKPMNTKPAKQAASRREFLRGGVRYTLLAGLAAMSASFVRRRGDRLPGQTCINEGICRGCSVFDDCGLPQALSAKQASGRKDA